MESLAEAIRNAAIIIFCIAGLLGMAITYFIANPASWWMYPLTFLGSGVVVILIIYMIVVLSS